jgi:hypothetical protein
MIYVAHPYSGVKRNVKTVTKIIRKLSAEYPHTFICPLTAFGDLYNVVEYDTGMNYCIELLSHCNKAIFLGDWYMSKGCKIEHEYCRVNNIPILYADQLDKLKE